MPRANGSQPPLTTTPFQLSSAEAAVISAIRTDGPLSRTDLARRLSTSRASMTSIVNRLRDTEILIEVGQGKSAGGRPPALLGINGRLGYVAGIDIGATSLDIALANFRGVILERHAEEADVRVGAEPLLGRACQIIEDMLARQDASAEWLVAAGIGVPGPVEFSRGVLIAPPLMPTWEGYPIKAFVRSHFPRATVVVDNDVNIMALGEREGGGGQGIDNFLFIKIGTGIGCGIICKGEVYRGSDGCAGDVGHICVDYNGPVCHCGNQGCLEIMAAGPAIAARGLELAQSGESPFLARRLQENDGALTAVDVGDAVAAGDRHASQIVRESGRRIGGVLAGLVNFYNPRAILIGGGVANIGHLLLSSIRQATLRRANPLSTRDLRIEYASLGADSGVVGAMTLALEHVFVVDG